MEILGVPAIQICFYITFFSVIGYLCEVVYAAVQTGTFVNRGFLFGPYCPIYGFAVAIMAVFLKPLSDNLFFLFIGALLLCSLLEYVTGFCLEKLLGKRLWDYCDEPMNIRGYVCLKFSILWGIAGVLVVRLILPIIDTLLNIFPLFATWIVIAIVTIAMLSDFAVTILSVLNLNRRLTMLSHIAENVHKQSQTIGDVVSKETFELKAKYDELLLRNNGNIRRLLRAFPKLKSKNYNEILAEIKDHVSVWKEKKREEEVEREKVVAEKYGLPIAEGVEKPFAYGICYSKLFALFFVGCFIGFVVETIWCLLTIGHFEVRTGLVWGPFIPVYGGGAVLITLCLYRLRAKRDLWIFIGAGIIGGAFEYVCSLFQELVFGTVSWDYSNTPLNFGGRTNMMFVLFWGFLGLLWLKDLYPRISRGIERIPKKLGMILTIVLTIYMIVNMFVSSTAVLRRSARAEDISAKNSYEVWLDEVFPDAYLSFIYPNMVDVGKKETLHEKY